MSYDVFVFKFPETYSDVSEIPANFVSLPTGTGDEVRAAISLVFPGTNWSDPTWGDWNSDLGSIEFNIGSADPVRDFAMHIRASDAVMTGVVQLCRDNGWQAADGQESFIEKRSQSAEALNAWRNWAYRDRNIKP